MVIFVGNLSFSAAEADLKKLFLSFGNVISAAIVMRKEKNAPKSRGFGFVEMPDDEEALAAIAALNEKEFMGRIINVSPAHSKAGAVRKTLLKNKRPVPEAKVESCYPAEGPEQKKIPAGIFINKPGTYKGGRRTRSYMIRHGLTGTQIEVNPRRRNLKDNPMRWRKNRNQPGPRKLSR